MKKIKIFVYFLVIILAIAGYFFYRFYQKKTADDFTQEENVSDFEDKIPSQCENGEWTEFPDYAKAGENLDFQENVRLKETDGKFTSEDGSIIFTTDEKYSLMFFRDRDTRIEGINIGGPDRKETYVKRIKCVGEEANKDVQSQRQNLMKYISDNINTLALEKSPNSQWQVQTFYFYNDSDLYVEYESPASIGGDVPYDAHLWLIRATKLERPIPVIETLAYIQEDKDDPDKNIVKSGQDLYKDANNMTVYEYDDDQKTWVLQ